MSAKMREALNLADIALAGAQMNMKIVERKIAEALAEQPAQGEAVACLTPELAREWLAYEGEDRGPAGFEAAIRAIAESAPPAPVVPDEQKLLPDSGERDAAFVKGWNACRDSMLASGGKASVPDDVAEAARYFKAQGGHIAGLGVSRAANILWDYINDVLSAAPEVPRG